jgi:uncharacterized protein YeaO (DUF488 family)
MPLFDQGGFKMPLRIVQLGSPRLPDEGLRIGTVRRPPRGVRKTQYSKLNIYDVWLPNLSPSEELLKKKLVKEDGTGWSSFERSFRAELKQPDKSHLLDALAALSHETNFSIGCYCNDEKRCHRSILRAELKKRGALIK